MRERVAAIAGARHRPRAGACMAMYPGLNPAERLIAITTDCNFRIRSLVLAQRRAALKRAAGLDVFVRMGNAGARRQAEVPARDGRAVHLQYAGPDERDGGSAEAQALADTMSSVWATFARNGTPRAPVDSRLAAPMTRRAGDADPGQGMPNRERSTGRRPATMAGHHRHRLRPRAPKGNTNAGPDRHRPDRAGPARPHLDARASVHCISRRRIRSDRDVRPRRHSSPRRCGGCGSFAPNMACAASSILARSNSAATRR